jgi:hypothetical protein
LDYEGYAIDRPDRTEANEGAESRSQTETSFLGRSCPASNRQVFEGGEMMAKKITPLDLRKQADELIAAGKMPSLDAVLQAVAETREKYVPLIVKAREEAKKKE